MFGKTPIDLLRLRNSLLSLSSTFEVEIFFGEYSGKSKKVSVSCIPYLRRTKRDENQGRRILIILDSSILANSLMDTTDYRPKGRNVTARGGTK